LFSVKKVFQKTKIVIFTKRPRVAAEREIEGKLESASLTECLDFLDFWSRARSYI
jgi:hypothetical protein